MHKDEYDVMFQTEDTHWWFASKRAMVSIIFSSLPPVTNRRIVDVGSGTGGMTAHLTRYGTVQGIEKHGHAATLAASRGLDIITSDANTLPIVDESVDVVTMFDVLYHKNSNATRMLSESYRILKPGGHIVITDCAVPLLWSPHDERMHARERFTRRSLTRLIEERSFTISRASYMYFFPFPLFVISRLLDRIRPASTTSQPSHLINAALSMIMGFERLLFSRGFDLPIGSSVILCAQKEK